MQSKILPYTFMALVAGNPLASEQQGASRPLEIPSPTLSGLAGPALSKADLARRIEAIEACPEAVKLLGNSVQVMRTWNIGTAGIWSPPVAHCTHKAYVKGDRQGATLYFALEDGGNCFHLHKHSGRMRPVSDKGSVAIFITIDVANCKRSQT